MIGLIIMKYYSLGSDELNFSECFNAIYRILGSLYRNTRATGVDPLLNCDWSPGSNIVFPLAGSC